jgi:beta-lactamase superfamily II metal-dependent hydrolase/DNA/RNA endonuclease YhcR with UshA esterase domain
MPKKLTAFAALVLLLLTQRPHAQAPAGNARIYFIDIGQGASTLVVSPTGKTLLVDGGADGSATKIAALMTTLGIAAIDYTVVTHYHIDHISGITELIDAGQVNGKAFDNGDGADVQPPGTSTSPASTRGHYLAYKTAIANHPSVTRQTVMPGTPDGVIDLGGGMRATFLAAGGRLLSGGQAAITNQDLNSESVSVLVEFNNFDYLVSGDLTGGGSTATAKTPDIETYVAQMAGDVDVVQLDHHGSTTASNQTFLAALKAEVAFAQTGESNTFGHPNRETVNKYLNTATTGGNTFTGTGVSPALGIGPVFYQNEASPNGDDRVTQQGYTGAAAGNAGQGTILLATDGATTYSLSSFDDGGTRLPAAAHTYPVDGASAGVTADFAPTVIAQTTPALPLAGDIVTIGAAVNDRESPIASVTLAYSVNGVAQSPIAMTLTGGIYQAAIPAQPDGARVDYAIGAAAGGHTTTFGSGYFSGVTPISSIRAINPKGEPLYAGYAARIQGTVTASGFSVGTNDDYVQDATGGVNVFRSSDTPTPFTSTTPGQIVEVRGRIAFNGGRLRLDVTESVEKTTSPYGVVVLSTGPAPSPAASTISAIAANLESFEGQLVAIANCQIVAGTIPATPQPLDAFVTISDGTGSFSLKIDHDTDIEGFTPAATFTAVGIVQQDDFLRPFDAGYDLAPRSRVDVGAAAPTPPPLVTIGEARIDELNNVDGTPGADFIPDRLNQIVRVQGTVTSIDFRGGTGIEYYVQDATGGIDLFSTSLGAGPFAIGDTVEATGAVTQFNGLTELTVSAVSFIAAGNAPAPALITLSQLANGNGEAFEGRLVRIDNVTITGGLFPAANASGNVTIADATGTGTLRVDSDTNIDGTATPSGAFSVTGVLGQFSSAPFDSGYQVLPRFLADIVASGGGGPALTALPATIAFPTTTVGSASVAPITITNNGTSPLTLTTPFTITGADASQFQVGAPGATTLDPATSTTASVTFLPTTVGAKSATLNIASTAGSTTVSLTGTAQAAGGGTATIVISQIRVRGPLGGNDEFVEIYNNSDNPADISGWKLLGSSATAPTGQRAIVPAGVVLPSRSHYLFVNSTATTGYSGTVAGNVGYTTGIADAGGAALADAANNIVDQVGIATTGATAYHEGTPLAGLGTTNLDRSYQRTPGAGVGSVQDTSDNSADFQLITPSNPQNTVLTAAPSSIDFGSVGPGDTRSQAVTIKNLLLTSVTLSSPFVITGVDAGSFNAGLPAATTLTTGATTTATVRFQPAAPGTKNASLAITSSSAGSVVVPLRGTGTAGLFVSPASIDFGTVAPGSSAAATVTIGNSDATSISLTPPFAIVGADAADFSVGAPGATLLAPDASTSVAVSFQPAAPGVKNATLQVTSAGGTRTVALTGTGTCPGITLDATLPGGRVGSAYAGIVTASGDAGPFKFTLSTGSLPAGLTLAADGAVSGTPADVGSSTFTVQTTAANGCSGSASFTIAIAPPALTASPSTVDYGIVAVPGSATASITLTNNTAGPITLTTPFAITGTNAAQFSAVAPAATTLAGGASTTVSVTFTPAAAGVKTATLAATSTGGGFATVVLTGAGSVATPVVISEIRFRGPSGGNDELVEIYNNTDAAIDISGWKLMGSSNAAPTGTRATVPAATILPARTHYLFVNTAANGYSGVVPGNVSYTTGIADNGGVALTMPDNTIVDQVGITTTGTAYREATPIATQLTTNVDRGYERKPGHAATALQDTDTNALDFALVTPTNAQSLRLTAGAASLDFGAVDVGQNASLNATVKNNLLVPATLTPPFTIAGADTADFSVAPQNTITLASGETSTAVVTFHPSGLGAKSASLVVTSNGGNATVALRGRGIDTTPPTLKVPSPTMTEATGATTVVSFEASATDLVDDAPVVMCVPASGFAFPVATTTVDCTATDASGNMAHGSFTVTVTDHTAPVITVSAAVTAEATGPLTPLTFEATATDLVDGSVPVSCTPASGSGFPVGTTPVNCTAIDAHGNTATASFTVTVRDTTPPKIASVTANPASLWPPNGKLVPIAISAGVTDAVDRSSTCAITSVTSSQPAAGGASDWTTPNGLTVSVRAARAGSERSGRVYTIGITCVDSAGNDSSATTHVVVPHDQRK